MYYIKHFIKVTYGWLLSMCWFRKKKKYYWLIWGHIGEVVYALSLIKEVKRIRGIETISLIVAKPFNQIAELYQDKYIDIKVISEFQLGCITTYANSPMCFHKNILGYSWRWEETKWYSDVFGVYIPGFEYKVRDLKVPYSTKHSAITKHISEEEEGFADIIKKYGIKKDKSVILIPYAQSAKMLDMKMWEKLVLFLNDSGYKTYTNIKDKSEHHINGSVAIQIPFKYVISLVNYAGSAVSIRCGLTDLLAVGNCDCETLYIIENEIDETAAEVWSTKLGKDNILYNKKWYIRKEKDFDYFLDAMRKKYALK